MTEASNTTFGVALALYLVAMVGYLHHFAYRRPTPLTVARVVAYLGLASHTVSVVLRGVAAERVPWGNMYEYASVVGLAVVALYLVVAERRVDARRLGGFVLGATVLIMAASTMVYVEPGPLIPALNSGWLRIHVLAAILASALFTLGFVFTVLYLIQERRERRVERAVAERPAPAMASVGSGLPHDLEVEADPEEGRATVTLGPEQGNGHGGMREGPTRRGRLPEAAALDDLAAKAITFAFPIWTFAVIAGAIWAEQAWGRYWGWDPKEVWSFVTWVLFAGYLHARATQGWRGRRAAVLAVLGFAALAFNLTVVNLVVSGLHSYAGV
ncbi:MAG TPA: c-type cytochrome biogenesis protein CcsB [Actinomycetota bacterium]